MLAMRSTSASIAARRVGVGDVGQVVVEPPRVEPVGAGLGGDMLDQRQPVDHVAGLDRLDRGAAADPRGRELVGDEREPAAQLEDDGVEEQARPVVETAFELIPEQRSQALAVAHPFDHAHRQPHALRREVDAQ